MAFNRIQRELAEVAKASDAEKGIVSLEAKDGRLDQLTGVIKGPPGSPYDGGTYALDIKIPPEYPFKPPEVKFNTRVWHPNVSSVTGAICLDILRTNWAAAMTLRTVMISIQALLGSPVRHRFSLRETRVEYSGETIENNRNSQQNNYDDVTVFSPAHCVAHSMDCTLCACVCTHIATSCIAIYSSLF